MKRIEIILALILIVLRITVPSYAVNDPDYATTKTPGLKIDFLGEDISPYPPKGFMSEVFVVSSKSGKCPPKAEIAIAYNAYMARPAGIRNLRIFRLDKAKKTWVPIRSSKANEKQQSISAKITSLGLYTVSAIHVNDTEAPKADWKRPVKGATLKGKEKLTVIATDNVGVSDVLFLLGDGEQYWQLESIYDNKPNGNLWSLTADFSKFVSGNYTLEAHIGDNADHDTVIKLPVVLKTNAPKPQVTISIPLFDETKHAVVISGTALANSRISWIAIELDKRALFPKVEVIGMANTASWSYMFVPGGYGPGPHDLSVMIGSDYPGYVEEAKIPKDQTILALSAVCFPSLSDEESLPEEVVPYEESDKLVAAATGGNIVQYQFEIDGIIVKPFGPENWCDKPANQGDHVVKVLAREKGADICFAASTIVTVKPVEPVKPLETNVEASPQAP